MPICQATIRQKCIGELFEWGCISSQYLANFLSFHPHYLPPFFSPSFYTYLSIYLSPFLSLSLSLSLALFLNFSAWYSLANRLLGTMTICQATTGQKCIVEICTWACVPINIFGWVPFGILAFVQLTSFTLKSFPVCSYYKGKRNNIKKRNAQSFRYHANLPSDFWWHDNLPSDN